MGCQPDFAYFSWEFILIQYKLIVGPTQKPLHVKKYLNLVWKMERRILNLKTIEVAGVLIKVFLELTLRSSTCSEDFSVKFHDISVLEVNQSAYWPVWPKHHTILTKTLPDMLKHCDNQPWLQISWSNCYTIEIYLYQLIYQEISLDITQSASPDRVVCFWCVGRHLLWKPGFP